MRTRLFVISSLALAALAGGASMNAAVAGPPQCCGDKVAPKPTTTTTQPKGPGDFQQPTTTTIPKGPDDLAPKPPQGDDPNPNGPDDLAPAPKGGGVEPGPDTTGNGSGSDNYVPPVDDATDNGVESSVEDAQSDGTSEAAAKQSESDRIPAFLIIAMAAVVGALLALIATRFRRNDEDVERV